MNNYIIPFSDSDNVWIKKISARSENDCKQKIIEMYRNEYETDDYEDLLDALYDSGILVGDIIDIETL